MEATESSGGILTNAGHIFRRHRLQLIGAAVLPHAAMFLFIFLVGQLFNLAFGPVKGKSVDLVEVWRSMTLLTKLYYVLAFIILAGIPQSAAVSGIALIIEQDASAVKVTAGQIAASVRSRFVTLVGLGFVIALGLFIGSLLCIAPGLVFAALTAFAIPAATIENLRALPALRRSFQLTRGRALQLIGIFILAGLGVLFVNGFMRVLLPGPPVVFVLVLFLILLAAAFINVMAFIPITLLYLKARVAQQSAGS